VTKIVKAATTKKIAAISGRSNVLDSFREGDARRAGCVLGGTGCGFTGTRWQ
jgi:hypothetical protein